MTVEIVILAMIAAFLGLRLYSVLGRRAEHEEEPIQGRFDTKPDAVPSVPSTGQQPANTAQRQRDLPPTIPAVERGLREIVAADRKFDAFAFLDGARGAYRMVLEAFWRGDAVELKQLCDADVYEGFVAAIEARTTAGETLENRLIRIEDATISAASYTAGVARITVRFTADIASVTRDAAGQMIAGSLDDALEATDVWTFSRAVKSADPDWLLDETDEG